VEHAQQQLQQGTQAAVFGAYAVDVTSAIQRAAAQEVWFDAA
jgi:hypothetical protein